MLIFRALWFGMQGEKKKNQKGEKIPYTGK